MAPRWQGTPRHDPPARTASPWARRQDDARAPRPQGYACIYQHHGCEREPGRLGAGRARVEARALARVPPRGPGGGTYSRSVLKLVRT